MKLELYKAYFRADKKEIVRIIGMEFGFFLSSDGFLYEKTGKLVGIPSSIFNLVEPVQVTA